MLPVACTCSRLRRAARIAGALYDEALAPAGITTAQFALLRMLGRVGPASLTALGEATGHDRTTLNRTLKPIEDAGLIQSGTGKDARKRIVKLSDAGFDKLEAAIPLWEAAQSVFRRKMGPDIDLLHELLDRIQEFRA
jgi:DNA-binding MarR family transcriptional regulator